MRLLYNKHWFLSILLLFSMGFLLSFVFSLFSGPVSLKSRHLIQKGMTKEEVISILGAPPGDYTTGDVLYGGLQQTTPPSYSTKRWTTNDGEIMVAFDEDGKVIGKAFNKPKVSIGWFEEKWDSILESLGLRNQRIQCIN